MKLENPTPFEAQITTTFNRDCREVVVLAVKGSFDFPEAQGQQMTLSEVQEELFLADVFGPDPETDAPVFENDFAPFKPRCDVLVHGPALAPGGQPARSVDVGVRLGNWSKALTVHGPRIWLKSGVGHSISDTRPFLRQPISYDLAWGGVDPEPDDPTRFATCEENPAGVGYYPHRSELEGAPLPVTAEYRKTITDASGPHVPMAFGPLGRTWRPRRNFVGTYDQQWMDTRMPFPPKDFDDRYHQATAPDQQIPFPKGGEPVELLNFTAEGRLRMSLPRDKVVVTFQRKHGPVTQKVANLDTVLVLTETRKLCLTWRTSYVANRDIHELGEIIVRRDAEGVAV